MPKRTYQPKNLKRLRKFGFMARKKTKGGRNVLKSRLLKGRKILTASDEYRVKAKKHKDKIK